MFAFRSIAAFALLSLASGAVASTLPRQNSNPPPIFTCNTDTVKISPSDALRDSNAVVPWLATRMAFALRRASALVEMTKVVNY
ncbi:hypothetical protein BDN72DRAFT_896031 [Pluteus cervinus]|uniref:Uncharacterized protein n=1 Tax=Pluteus cervinus TaxID=181527 RepID=A0ACD3AYP2_9AGAR|nr:hypothetical protein BDN72DRAFT_896031 [Pluteus cervinus]